MLGSRLICFRDLDSEVRRLRLLQASRSSRPGLSEVRFRYRRIRSSPLRLMSRITEDHEEETLATEVSYTGFIDSSDTGSSDTESSGVDGSDTGSSDADSSDDDIRSMATDFSDYGDNNSEILDHELLYHSNNMQGALSGGLAQIGIDDWLNSDSDTMSWSSDADMESSNVENVEFESDDDEGSSDEDFSNEYSSDDDDEIDEAVPRIHLRSG